MRWSIERSSVKKMTLEEAVAESAARLVSGGYSQKLHRAVYAFLLTSDEGELDFDEFSEACHIDEVAIRSLLVGLEGAGLVTINRSSDLMVLVLTSCSDQSIMSHVRDDRVNLLTRQTSQYTARSKAVDDRRAARPSQLQSAKTKTPARITAHTVYVRWKEAQSRVFPSALQIPWTKAQLGMAKKLIERLGEEKTLEYVDLVFDGWNDMVARHGFRGYPTMQWCLGFLDSIGQELLTGTKIGKDKTQSMNPRTRALEKGEFNERASSREKDIGWEDD